MKETHPSIFFYNAVLEATKIQRNSLIHVYEKLDFNSHMKTNTDKTDVGIGLMRKLQSEVQKIFNIYKSFLKSHLDYGGFFSLLITLLTKKLESIQ